MLDIQIQKIKNNSNILYKKKHISEDTMDKVL